VVVEDQSQNETVAAGFRQAAKAREISRGHCGGDLDLDSDHSPAPVLDDDIDLFPLLVTEMRELVALLGPTGQFQEFAENESLQDRSEQRLVFPDAFGGASDQLKVKERPIESWRATN